MIESDNPEPIKSRKLSLTLDIRLVVILLLAIIVGMLLIWRPWQERVGADTQTVKVTGEATVKAEPDEYVFSPSYDVDSADKQTALSDITNKSNELVKQLKLLGVADSSIKTDTSSYESYVRRVAPTDGSITTYSFDLTVTVDTKALAQKVQDYLLTTTPTDSISPQPTFSDAKRKSLESQARDTASKDARAKADQSAKNLGFKVGSVKSVVDGTGFGNINPLYEGVNLMSEDKAESGSLSLQPGENELSYSVTVTYYIK